MMHPELPPLGDPLPISEEGAGAAPATPSVPRERHALGTAPSRRSTTTPPPGPTTRSSRPDRAVRGAAGTAVRVAAPAFFQVNTRREQRGPGFPSPEIVERFGRLIAPDGLSDRRDAGVARHGPPRSPGRRRRGGRLLRRRDVLGGAGAVRRQVVGIEESPAAVKDAEQNCAILPNLRFIAGKVEDVLPEADRAPDQGPAGPGPRRLRAAGPGRADRRAAGADRPAEQEVRDGEGVGGAGGVADDLAGAG